MNKIIVEVSAGELLDKISILEIKKEKIKNTEKLLFVEEEYNILKEYLNKNINLDTEIKKYFSDLKKTNLKLWKIEDEIRICEKNSDFSKIFIELARSVYFFNDERAKIKLDINKHTGSKIIEVKDYVDY